MYELRLVCLIFTGGVFFQITAETTAMFNNIDLSYQAGNIYAVAIIFYNNF